MAQQMEIKRREEQEYIYRRKTEKNWRDYRSQQENGVPFYGGNVLLCWQREGGLRRKKSKTV